MSSQQPTQQQQPKLRKCSNIGCDVLITFVPKTRADGTKGWSAMEKDSIGQLVGGT